MANVDEHSPTKELLEVVASDNDWIATELERRFNQLEDETKRELWVSAEYSDGSDTDKDVFGPYTCKEAEAFVAGATLWDSGVNAVIHQSEKEARDAVGVWGDCERCGHPAEVERQGENLCMDCATWMDEEDTNENQEQT